MTGRGKRAPLIGVGLVAIGHTYLIIAGQNDLSPGSVAAFSGVLAALLVSWGLNFWLVKSLCNLDEKTTFQTWTMMETIVGTTGFVVALIVSIFA